MLVFFINSVFFGILGWVFDFNSSFLSNRRLWVVLGEKSLQECRVHPGVPQGSIFGPTPFPRCIKDLPEDIVFVFVIHAWQQIKLTWELESDIIWEVEIWSRERLVDLVAGETRLVSFYHWNNSDVTDVKMDVSVPDRKLFFKVMKLSFSSELGGVLIFSQLQTL